MREDRSPVVFETVEAILADSRWNELLPLVRYSEAKFIFLHDTTEIRLTGKATGLKTGDRLLLIPSENNADNTKWVIVSINRVEVHANEGYTLLLLGDKIYSAIDVFPLREPLLYSLNSPVSLFGYNAPVFTNLPESVKNKYVPRPGGILASVNNFDYWHPLNTGLPELIGRKILITGSGIMIFVSNMGIFKATADNTVWQPSNSGLTTTDLHTLYEDERGCLYAGGAQGKVFYSTDSAESWTQLRGGAVVIDSRSGNKHHKHIFPNLIHWFKGLVHRDSPVKTLEDITENSLVSGRIPSTIVNTITSFSIPGDKKNEAVFLVLVGTEVGLWLSKDNGQLWEPSNENLPGFDTNSRTANVNVLTINVYTSASATDIFIGTDQGVFRGGYDSKHGLIEWATFSEGLPVQSFGSEKIPVSVYCLTNWVDPENGERKLAAGSDEGVFVTKPDTEANWLPLNNGLIDPESGKTIRIPVVYTFLNKPGVTESSILAGTDFGIFIFDTAESKWKRSGRGLHILDKVTFTDLDSIIAALDQKKIPPALFQTFLNNGIKLPADAVVKVVKPGLNWIVEPVPESEKYFLSQTEQEILLYDIEGMISTPVFSLAGVAVGKTFAVTPLQKIKTTQWPGFRLQNHDIDLARKISPLEEDTQIALLEPSSADSPGLSRIYTISSMEKTYCENFMLKGTIDRLIVNQNEDLSTFDLRTTQAFIQDKKFDLFTERKPLRNPLRGKEITLDRVIHDFPTPRDICVSGSRMAVRLTTVAGGLLDINNEIIQHHLLPGVRVNSLLMYDSLILVGTEEGVLLYDNASWLKLGQLRQECVNLFLAKDKRIYATFLYDVPGSGGIYCLDDFKTSDLKSSTPQWYSCGLKGKSVFSVRKIGDTFYAATEDGIYVYHIGDNGGSDASQAPENRSGNHYTWENDGLNGIRINSLYILKKNYLLAATDDGVYMLSKGTWEAAGLQGQLVNCIEESPELGVFAGTAEGIQRFYQNEWRSFALRGMVVRSIYASKSSDLYIATEGSGVFNIDPQGGVKNIPTGIFNNAVIIKEDKNNNLFVGLDTSFLLRKADQYSTASISNDYYGELNTELIAELDQQFITNKIRSSLQSIGISLAQSACLKVENSGHSWFLENESRSYQIIRSLDSLNVYLAPVLTAIRQHDIVSEVENRLFLQYERSIEGYLDALNDQFKWHFPTESSGVVSEIIRVINCCVKQEHTVLTLEAPLKNVYDPIDTKLFANLAYASEGNSVHNEILGSGNASIGNQVFTLQQPPVSQFEDQQTGKLVNTLSFGVSSTGPVLRNGNQDNTIQNTTAKANDFIPWQEVKTLVDSSSSDHDYVVEVDVFGRTTIMTGNGVNGARLPSGNENIRASYRSGSGAKGNLGAKELIILTNRPAGIKSVLNPVPATGGTNRESTGVAVENAISATYERLIALGDYRLFSIGFQTIKKASVHRLH
ncbi:MAG: hypothetical protein AAFP70_04085 [Calditrichota bacterium]